jgi:hypothetical protein
MGSFVNWLAERHPPKCSPAPHGVLMALKMAGPEGISRRELGNLFDLEGQLMNRLLAAYASVGLLTASEENGETLFRSS